MKPSNIVVMIALATLAVGCQKKAEVTILSDPDPKGTKYILEFNSKTKVKSVQGFTDALDGVTFRWERNVKIGDGHVRPSYSNFPPDHPNYDPQTSNYPKPGDGLATLHVTQRVGVYSDDDLKKITDQIRNP